MKKKPTQSLAMAYAAWVIRWRWPVLIACILAALIAGLGIRYFEMTADYRVFFNADNPGLKAFDAFEDTYTNTDNVLFVFQPGNKNVFTRQTLGVVRGLAEEAWQIRDFTTRAESRLAEKGLPSMRSKGARTTIMFALFIDRNVRSMLTGTALAFLLIALTLIVALRSLKLGLINLVSNFIPVALTFGLWAILVGEMGIIASVITATSLGLIVDDMVHILSKYRRARREHRLSSHDAIRSFGHVGTALWATTLILVAGFVVLSFSSFKINSDMGVLTSITLVFALMVDFLLLPPLLMRIEKDEVCGCVACVNKTTAGLT